MKRIISLCCVALIFVTCMAVPVSAAETSSGWVNVLDYATANDSGSNIVYRQTGTTYESINYSFVDNVDVVYIDMLFRTDGNAPSIEHEGKYLTVELVGNDGYKLYRAYGHLTIYNTFMHFNYHWNDCYWVDFVQISVSTTEPNGTDIEAYCEINATDYSQTIHYVPSDDVNYRLFSATDDFIDTWFTSYVWTEEWKKYDYIDFQLMFDVFEITSISAVMGSTNVPLEVSYLNGTAIEGNSYYVTIRMDVSKLDKSIDDYPMIVIMGRLDSGVLNSIDFANCSGIVVSSFLSPLAIHFRYLHEWILAQTVALGDHFGYLVTTLNDRFSNLEHWILNQTTALGDHFSYLITTLNDRFSNLEHWILTQTYAIQDQFSYLKNTINDRFSNLEHWINNQTASLEAAIRGDTSSGNAFQDEVQEELDELDQAQAVMDSVTKPAVDSIDVSMDRYVSQSDITVLASPMAVFFEAEIFRTVIIMSILLATVSYVLYGKR